MITVKNRVEFLFKVADQIADFPKCVELGVLIGDFSETILKVLKPSRLFLIDPFANSEKKYGAGMSYLPVAYSTMDQYEFVLNRFRNNERVFLFKDFSYNSAKLFDEGSLNFIYHDASHLYEDLKKDLIEWRFKISRYGLICGHDYIDHPSFGVKQAVDEFCAEHNFEMIIYNSNDGDYALRAIQ